MFASDWSKWLVIYIGAYLLGSISFAYLFGRMKGIDLRQHGSGNVGATNAGRVLGRRWGIACFVLDAMKGLLPPVVAGFWLGLYPSTGTLDLIGASTLRGDPATALEHLLWLGAGVTAVIGHMHSVFLGFRGGKGVAAGFGCMLGVYPHLTIPALGALLVWALALAIVRMMSAASMLAACSLPLFYLVLVLARHAIAGPAPETGAPTADGGSGAGSVVATPPPGGDASTRLFDDLETGWPFLLVTGVLAGVIVWKHRSNIQRILAGTEPRIGRRTPPTAATMEAASP